MIISFSWTTPALVAEPCRKSVTRRDWKPQHAARFHKGQIVDAYDKNPRIGGRKVAEIRLTADPYLEWTCNAPPEDYEAEGFAYLDEIGARVDGLFPFMLWKEWHDVDHSELRYVVRFERVRVIA